MDFSLIIAEERIKKAYEDGEFENLKGFGQPLLIDDLPGIPPELRMAFRMMKNAGYSLEAENLQKEILSIDDLIKRCEDQDEKLKLQKKLNEKILRFNSLQAEKRINTNSAVFKSYEQKIYNIF